MKTSRCTRMRAVALSCLPFAGAVLSTGAMAQNSVTLYGVVDNAFAYSSNQRGHSNFYMSQGNLQASKFGLLGAEELGGGTKAIFRLEGGFNSLTGAQSSAGVIFNRQAYVGLSNDRYGTVTLGRQYTPYFNMVGALGPTGVLTGATGAHPGDLDALDTTLRFNNSIAYASPTIAGLSFGAQYGLGGVPGSVTNGSNFSAALRYDYQAFSVAAGYVKLKDITTSQSLGSFAVNSPVNNGYASASSTQIIAAAARYNFTSDLMVGVNYSNVQYAPGSHSLFASEAVFNTYGAIATYRFTPSVIAGIGYSYTRASKANGIDDPAQYHQISLEQTYSLSKRTTLYALEAYQLARGKSLIASGSGTTIADAVAVVGDSQNTTPSSGPSQFVGMVGIRHAF
ncbi:porin [Paraburkholderia azotifigens]|uniref:porin n=1 Tax=Paraburkholderia azotifigens TaxID=2057004 RepID=UPI00317600FE